MFEHGQHLLRAAGLLVGGILVFVIARGFLIPDGFGDLGHYRPGALADNANHEIHFAGRQACAECHTDIVEMRAGSKHERVGCEACHGALAAHAADPASVVPQLPDAQTLCLVCHRSEVTRPASFPQIDPAEHGEGSSCTECHQPHHPEIE